LYELSQQMKQYLNVETPWLGVFTK
jgi:hypothetical protein